MHDEEVRSDNSKGREKGWVVIPVEYRGRYGLKPSDTVNVVDYRGVLALVPSLEDPVNQARAMPRGVSLTTSLLEERARERERES